MLSNFPNAPLKLPAFIARLNSFPLLNPSPVGVNFPSESQNKTMVFLVGIEAEEKAKFSEVGMGAPDKLFPNRVAKIIAAIARACKSLGSQKLIVPMEVQDLDFNNSLTNFLCRFLAIRADYGLVTILVKQDRSPTTNARCLSIYGPNSIQCSDRA